MSFKLALILGGARSGKSAYAEQLAINSKLQLTYVATSQIYDGEMRDRVDKHVDRRGPEWTTREEPLNLLRCLQQESSAEKIILVDCLTLWLTNILLDETLDPTIEIEKLISGLHFSGPVIFVSNEVGFGIVPENKLARRFRDLAGTLHQQIAAQADLVTLVAAGLPLTLKQELD